MSALAQIIFGTSAYFSPMFRWGTYLTTGIRIKGCENEENHKKQHRVTLQKQKKIF